MRLRHVKGAKQKINNHPELIVDHTPKKPLYIDKKFKDKALHVEIGMGKGQFIYELASRYPNCQFIGIERYDSVIVRALEKSIEAPLENLLLVRADADYLSELFSENSIDRLYLNFSDPWPKNRHEKRRLTHHRYLKEYERLLKSKAEIHFKTDNVDLFEYSLESVTSYPMNIQFVTRDLHSEEVFNVMTEFEAKFKKLNKKIHKLVATFEEEKNG